MPLSRPSPECFMPPTASCNPHRIVDVGEDGRLDELANHPTAPRLPAPYENRRCVTKLTIVNNVMMEPNAR
jgi:hypothetical protein